MLSSLSDIGLQQACLTTSAHKHVPDSIQKTVGLGSMWPYLPPGFEHNLAPLHRKDASNTASVSCLLEDRVIKMSSGSFSVRCIPGWP